MSPLLNRKVRENYTCLIRRRVNLCHCARTNVRFRLFCAINHRCHRISLISVLGVWFWLWIAFEEVHTTTLLPLLVKESMEKLFLSKVQTYDYTIPMKCSLILNYACLLSFAWKESCDGMNYVLCIFLGEMQGCGCRHEKLGLVGQGLILCAVGLNSVGSGCHTIYLYTMD